MRTPVLLFVCFLMIMINAYAENKLKLDFEVACNYSISNAISIDVSVTNHSTVAADVQIQCFFLGKKKDKQKMYIYGGESKAGPIQPGEGFSTTWSSDVPSDVEIKKSGGYIVTIEDTHGNLLDIQASSPKLITLRKDQKKFEALCEYSGYAPAMYFKGGITVTVEDKK